MHVHDKFANKILDTLMNRYKKIIALAAAVIAVNASHAITVHTIGDSTMASYDESTTEQRGWAQMLEQFFTGLTVNNRAKSGASSKSFYQETAFWTSVKKQISEGDYVFIQFAHNDEKNGGTDGDSLKAYYTSIGDTATASSTDYRGTTPFDTYKAYLRNFVNETRELGATPVLIAPICRRNFSSGDISRKGRHDIGDSFSLISDKGFTTGNSVPEDDNTYDYPYQMSLVAEELDVPFIDLTTATADLYISYGDTESAELLFMEDDGTHTNAMGATLIARLCAQLLQEADILTDYISLTSELTVSPDTCDFGAAYKGQTLTEELRVTGFDLVPEEGAVSVIAGGNLLVSTDGTDYSDTITLSYEGGNMIETFMVQYTMGEAGAVSDSLTVMSGDITIVVPVTGRSVVLADGTAFSAYWRLESDDDCETDGPVTVIGETYSEMVLQKYSTPNSSTTTWPDWTGYDSSRKTQRNVIEGELWPEGEVDEVSTRYIDFAVSAPEGTTLNVDSISLFACGCGGNGMCCKIYYFVDDNISDDQCIASFQNMAKNSMQYVSATPVLALNGGQTLHIRLYPWYNSEVQGKTLCISDVHVSGVTADETETRINDTVSTSDDDVISVTYYNVNGMVLDSLREGLNIVRTKYADGRLATHKYIM